MSEATFLSRRQRWYFEVTAYAVFLLIVVVPIAVAMVNGDLVKRVVDLQGPILSAETAIGVFVGWMKTLGHRENMQQMQGGS